MKTKIFKHNPIYIKENLVLGILSPLLLVLFTVFTSCSSDETQTVATFTVLDIADEFDTDGMLNSTNWDYEIGTGENGWGNNELQYYTDRTENITVQNGILLITAQKEQFEGSSYTSARISTKGIFERAYGRFEARIRVPGGSGLWPAFWMLGADCNGAGETESELGPFFGDITFTSETAMTEVCKVYDMV